MKFLTYTLAAVLAMVALSGPTGTGPALVSAAAVRAAGGTEDVVDAARRPQPRPKRPMDYRSVSEDSAAPAAMKRPPIELDPEFREKRPGPIKRPIFIDRKDGKSVSVRSVGEDNAAPAAMKRDPAELGREKRPPIIKLPIFIDRKDGKPVAKRSVGEDMAAPAAMKDPELGREKDKRKRPIFIPQPPIIIDRQPVAVRSVDEEEN